ncbi:MAG: hypothetical protein VKK42_04275 [Lyngbya sp.]|nr:hypothetical protein [Lyngbya sp.]
MIPEKNSQQRSFKTILIHFLIGVFVGLFPLLLPFSYGGLSGNLADWSQTQISLSIILPLTVGLISAIFGERCLNLLAKMLDQLPIM